MVTPTRPAFAADRLRALLSAALCLLAVLVLTCRKWDNPLDSTGNHPPSIPSNPDPDTNATDRDPRSVLTWHSVDPDGGDTARFSLFLGDESLPPLVADSLTDTTFSPTSLDWGKTYFWRVFAWDNHGDTARGPLWRFTVITDTTNKLPVVPHTPAPASGATGLFLYTRLSWHGGDPDAGDTAFYDVYFGTDSPPPLVASKQRDSAYAPALAYGTHYYWEIVARDNHGAQSPGPFWQFSTVAALNITAPDTGERLRMYTTDTITWTGGPGDARRTPGLSRVTLQIDGVKGLASGMKRRTSGSPDAVDSTIVYRSANNGASWIRLGRATAPGQFVWQVPEPATESARVRVRAYASADTMSATSGRFAIYDTVHPSAITVTSPADTSVWAVGSAHDVTWTGGTDGVDSSVVWFSTDGGDTWSRQGVTLTPGVFPWIVPGPAATMAVIEVRAYNVGGVTTARSDPFSVVEPPYPNSVVAIVVVGTQPTALCYDSIDNRVFVGLRRDTVSVLDGNTNGVIKRIKVGRYPCALVWNPAGNKVYVANDSDGTVTVINAAGNAVAKTVPVGANPTALCLNPANNKVYVANSGANTVSVIGSASDSVVTTVAVGTNPQAVYWNSSDNKVYVASFGADSVSVIDGVTNQVVQAIAVDAGPCAITADRTHQKTYIAGRTSGKVTIINAAGQVVKNLVVSQEPWAMAANPANGRVYAANSGSSTVTVIDAASDSIRTNVPVAQQPRTLMWAWQVGKLYVACHTGNRVAIIDGVSNEVLRTVQVGTKPSSLCWNGTATKVYVANFDDNTVSVLGVGAKERP